MWTWLRQCRSGSSLQIVGFSVSVTAGSARINCPTKRFLTPLQNSDWLSRPLTPTEFMMAGFVEQEKYLNEFDPREYLTLIYTDPVNNIPELRRITDFYSTFPDNSLNVLEYSGGPSILQLINSGPKASSIVFSDYLEKNRVEIKKWLNRDPESFDWSSAIKCCLEVEGSRTDATDIYERQELLRNKIEAVVHCDLTEERIIEKGYDGPYDVVTCIGVLDGICGTKDVFKQSMKKLSTLVKVGGYLVVATDANKTYEMSGLKFDSPLALTEEELKIAYSEAGFGTVSCLPYKTFGDVILSIGQKTDT